MVAGRRDAAWSYHVRMSENFDAVIVGGGLVGMSLAAALDGSDLRVLQIEAQPPPLMHPGWDERHFALGRASVERLRVIGVWQDEMAASPIREVHVSRAGTFGRVLLRAEQIHLADFGVTAPARLLVSALEQRLQTASSVQRWRPARLLRIERAPDHVRLHLDRNGTEAVIETRLLVAADGSDSPIRKEFAIGVEQHDYAQTAIVCAAEVEMEHGGRAYERFTDSGPIALLPLSGRRCGIVCTLDTAAAASALVLDDQAFAAMLQERFGRRLGRVLRVGARQPWPLRLLIAERVVDQRMVLIGNAAQTIHPIGAQGFNLGLRDASALAAVLRSTAGDPGANAVLQAYAAARADDREQTISNSHALLRLSSAQGLPMRMLQAAAMLGIDRVSPVRSLLARSSMGYRNTSHRSAPP